MHPEFPWTHNYLRGSLQDIDYIGEEIKAMKASDRGDRPSRDEPVDIERQTKPSKKGLSKKQLDENQEFRKRRLRNRAIRMVEEDMRSKGYTDKFIREHRDLVKEKVEAFLSS